MIQDGLLCELEQKAKEIAELQALIATAGEVAANAQVTSSSAFAEVTTDWAQRSDLSRIMLNKVFAVGNACCQFCSPAGRAGKQQTRDSLCKSRC